MNKNQAAAYVMAQTACAMAEIEGMKAVNQLSPETPAYYLEHFTAVIERYRIHHNDVLDLFHEATDE